MIEVTLFEPMYRTDISVITDCEFQVFANLIAERHPSEPLYSWDKEFELERGTDGYQFHVCGNAEGGGERFYVWMFQIEPYQQAHEFHHLAHDILFTRGIVYCEESEEAFAYLTGRLHEMFTEKTRQETA